MRFQVHSCTRDPVTVTVEFNGKPIEAVVHGLVVELVSEDGRSAQTLRYMPDDVAADEAKYQVGAKVEATYEVVEPAPAPAAASEPDGEPTAEVDPPAEQPADPAA